MDILKSPREERERLTELFNILFKGDYVVDKFTGEHKLLYEIQAVHRTKSSSKPNLLYYGRVVFSAVNGVISNAIDINGFMNESDKDLFQCFFLTKNKERIVVGKDNLVILNEVFYRIVLPADIAEKVINDGTQLSVRVGSREEEAYIQFDVKSPAKVFKLVSEAQVDEDEIDDIYDECAASFEAEVKRQEDERIAKELKAREKELEKAREAKEERIKKEYSSLVSKVRRLPINEFDTLEALITSPSKLKPIKDLTEFCHEHNYKSEALDYIGSLKKHYKTESILQDITRLRAKNNRITISNKFNRFSWWISLGLLILSIVVEDVPVFDYLFYISAAATVISFFMAKGELKYGMEASKLIEDFPKRISKEIKVTFLDELN